MNDKVAKAVEAVDRKPDEQKIVQIEMINVNLQIMGRPDRPAQVALPKDITDQEIIALMVGIAQVGDQLRAQRGPQLVRASALPNGKIS